MRVHVVLFDIGLDLYSKCSCLSKPFSELKLENIQVDEQDFFFFSVEQEHAIVDMVVQNNTLRLKEIQQRITQDNQLFHNIHQCSLSTIDRVLRRNAIRMKQVYKVPFERNSVRVKELRFQFVQVCATQLLQFYCQLKDIFFLNFKYVSINYSMLLYVKRFRHIYVYCCFKV